jgi:hypothetical protein
MSFNGQEYLEERNPFIFYGANRELQELPLGSFCEWQYLHEGGPFESWLQETLIHVHGVGLPLSPGFYLADRILTPSVIDGWDGSEYLRLPWGDVRQVKEVQARVWMAERGLPTGELELLARGSDIASPPQYPIQNPDAGIRGPCSFVLQGPERPLLFLGQGYGPVPNNPYKAVEALYKAYLAWEADRPKSASRVLSGEAFNWDSGLRDASRALGHLLKVFCDLTAGIRLPGKKRPGWQAGFWLRSIEEAQASLS